MLRRAHVRAAHLGFRQAVLSVLRSESVATAAHPVRSQQRDISSSSEASDVRPSSGLHGHPAVSLQHIIAQFFDIAPADSIKANDSFAQPGFRAARPPPPPSALPELLAEEHEATNQAHEPLSYRQLRCRFQTQLLPRMTQAKEMLEKHADVVAAMSLLSRDMARLAAMQQSGTAIPEHQLTDAHRELADFLQRIAAADAMRPSGIAAEDQVLMPAQHRLLRSWHPFGASKEAISRLSPPQLVLVAAAQVFDFFAVLGLKPPAEAGSTLMSLWTLSGSYNELQRGADAMIELYAPSKMTPDEWAQPGWCKLAWQIALALGKARRPLGVEALLTGSSEEAPQISEARLEELQRESLFLWRPGTPLAHEDSAPIADTPAFWAMLVDARVEAGNFLQAELWLRRYRDELVRNGGHPHPEAAAPYRALLRAALLAKPFVVKETHARQAHTHRAAALGIAKAQAVKLYAVDAVVRMMQLDDVRPDAKMLNLLIAFHAYRATQVGALGRCLQQLAQNMHIQGKAEGAIGFSTYAALFGAQFSVALHAHAGRIDARMLHQIIGTLPGTGDELARGMLPAPGSLVENLEKRLALVAEAEGRSGLAQQARHILNALDKALQATLAFGDRASAAAVLRLFDTYSLRHSFKTLKAVLNGLLHLDEKGTSPEAAQLEHKRRLEHIVSLQPAPGAPQLHQQENGTITLPSIETLIAWVDGAAPQET